MWSDVWYSRNKQSKLFMYSWNMFSVSLISWMRSKLSHTNPNISKGINRNSYNMKHLNQAICLFNAETNIIIVFQIWWSLLLIENDLNRKILFKSSQTVWYIFIKWSIIVHFVSTTFHIVRSLGHIHVVSCNIHTNANKVLNNFWCIIPIESK